MNTLSDGSLHEPLSQRFFPVKCSEPHRVGERRHTVRTAVKRGASSSTTTVLPRYLRKEEVKYRMKCVVHKKQHLRDIGEVEWFDSVNKDVDTERHHHNQADDSRHADPHHHRVHHPLLSVMHGDVRVHFPDFHDVQC